MMISVGAHTLILTLSCHSIITLSVQEFSEEKSILYNKQSEYQSILVFKSAQYGKNVNFARVEKRVRTC